MISTTLWILLFAQMAMGAADTIFHHELTQRLAWRPTAQFELRLHGGRNLIYALVFLGIGVAQPGGALAWGLLALLGVETVITLVDFVEEDRTRQLPWTERVLHTLLTLNYGLVLALLVPVILGWTADQSQLVRVDHGWISLAFVIAAIGVTISGVRDLLAARRCTLLNQDNPAELVAAMGARKAVLVTGGTGFIGARLITALIGAGHDVTLLARDPAKAARLGAPLRIITSLVQMPPETPCDVVINLAGEPIANGLWTKAKRARILASRVDMSRNLLSWMAGLAHRPALLVNGSAVGYYGLSESDTPFDEGSPLGRGFSAHICAAWEDEAARAEALGIRVVRLRIGLVLGHDGGMLGNLLFPFEAGLGGRIGSGRQWMSWIHRDDLVRLIGFVAGNDAVHGPVNAVAPNPERNAAFAAALGKVLNRPALLPLPAAPLRWLAGDLAEELLLSGQKVLPVKAVFAGFRFRYPHIEGALAKCVGQQCPTTDKHTAPLKAAHLLS